MSFRPVALDFDVQVLSLLLDFLSRACSLCNKAGLRVFSLLFNAMS